MSVVTKEMLDAAVVFGRNQERERIIKLLEEMRDTCFAANTDIGKHNGWTLENGIGLIKGENK